MYKYHDVAVMVEPKKALLATAQADLDQTLATLAVAQAKLKQVGASILKNEDKSDPEDHSVWLPMRPRPRSPLRG
jgi:hypothetical protein